MPRTPVDFDTVRRLARELGVVAEGTIHGAPSLKVGGRLLACLPAHKSAEPGSLVVRVDPEQRAKLIASAPDIYYLTDHYGSYPTVLVRMPRITITALRALLRSAWTVAHARPAGAKRATGKSGASRSRRNRSA